jgi:hypothetical protein
MYADEIKAPLDSVKMTIAQYQTKEAKEPDRVEGIDALMADGIKTKQLDRVLTKAELAELIEIPIR